jgi:hypothetical protein
MSDTNDKRATAQSFLQMGVLLATLRGLLGMPNAVYVYRDCPNCGADVPFLRDKRADGSYKITCSACPYTTTEQA